MTDRVSYEKKPVVGMYVGFVKSVVDYKFSGRLQVWIPELLSREDNESGWITCNYCSPFGGVTDWEGISENIYDTHEETQTSYGFWAVPPDINNKVVVLFLNGDITRAVWIGNIFGEFMNSMIPESPYSPNNKNKNGVVLPTTEYNKYDRRSGDAADPINAKRPWNKFKTYGLGNKGLIKDKIRGLSSSSSMRESPSMVFGISTPGRLIEDQKGARMGGHAIIMDDSVDNEHISLVTNSGSKIRIDDTNGLIYIINRDGNAWVQLDENGNVDVFSGGSISYRAKNDINFRADRNVNIEAGNNINIKAAADIDENGNYVENAEGEGGNINIEALSQFNGYMHDGYSLTVREGDINIETLEGDIYSNINGDYHTTISGGWLLASNTMDMSISESIRMATDTIDITTGGQLTMSNGTVSISAGPFAVDPTGNLTATAVTAASVAASGTVSSGSMSMDDFIGHTHGFIDANGAEKVTKKPVEDVEPVPVPSAEPSVANNTVLPEEGSGSVIIAVVTKVDVLDKFPDETITEFDGEVTDIPDWWNRETLEVDTIISRFMTYEPCPEHIKKGE